MNRRGLTSFDFVVAALIALICLAIFLPVFPQAAAIRNLVLPKSGTVLWKSDLPDNAGVAMLTAVAMGPNVRASVPAELTLIAPDGTVGKAELYASDAFASYRSCKCYMADFRDKWFTIVYINIPLEVRLQGKDGVERKYYIKIIQ
jgi:hypothetical protein